MSSENRHSSDGPRSDWRRGAPRDAGAKNVRTEGVRWKRLPKPQSHGISSSTAAILLKRVVSAMAATGFIAAMVWMLGLIGCSYTKIAPFAVDHLSEPAFAPPGQAQQEQDVELLRRSLPHVDAIPIPTQFTWTEWLRKLRDPKVTAYVFYLSATSLWQNENHAPERFFLLENSSPDEPGTWLPAKGLWTALTEELPQNTLKLVLIDTARAAPAWRGNGFGSEDFTDLQQAADSVPCLAVMTSCAPGERSWGSQHLGTTAFLHAIINALKGDADQGQAADRRLQLNEVLDFVAAQTNSWAEQNRTRWGQSPQQFVNSQLRTAASGENLVLKLSGRPKGVPPVVGGNGALEFHATLKSAWKHADDARQSEFWRTQPLKWRDFCFDIDRAEQLWLAGNLQQAREWAEEHKLDAGPQVTSVKLAELAWMTISPADQLERLLRKFARENSGWEIAEATIEAAVDLRAESEQAARAIGQRTQRFARLIAQRDNERRAWEDQAYSFSAPKTPDAKAQRDRWQEIQAHAKILAGARNVHERLLASLPNAADWAAQNMPLTVAERTFRESWVAETSRLLQEQADAPPSLPASDTLRSQWKAGEKISSPVEAQLILTDLFDTSRRLARELRAWETHSDLSDAELKDSLPRLQSLADAAEKQWKSFESRLDEAVKHAESLPSQPVQWDGWQQISNLLVYRGISSAQRKNLWDKLLLFDGLLDAGTSSPPGTPGTLAGQVAPQIHMSPDSSADAAWRSLWALQHLSLGVAPTDGRQNELNHLWVQWRACVREQDPREQHLKMTQLSAGTKQLAGDLAGQVRSLARSADRKTFEDMRKYFWDIDRAVRVLPGYDAHRGKSVDHSSAWPRWLRIEHGLWQARRYLDDFYAGDGPDNHWFDQAATACQKFVEAELTQWQPPVAVRKLVDEELAQVTELLAKRRKAFLEIAVPESNRFKFGTESELRLTCELQAHGDVPTGSAVLSLIAERDDRLAVTPAGHLLPTKRDSKQPLESRFQLTRKTISESECGPVSLEPRSWFRGHQHPAQAFAVDPCQPAPWTVVEIEPPNQGSLVVQGRDRKSLMFVFDCSESMDGSGPNVVPNLAKFFFPALDTLTKAIQNLDNRVPPYRVGLVAYAHRYRFRSDPKEVRINPKIPLASLDPALSNQPAIAYQQDYQTLFPMQDLQGGKSGGPQPIDQLIERLKLLRKAEPFGNTPLLGAIIHAIDELPAKKGQSGGLVVAITDGAAQDDGSTSMPDRTATLRNRLIQNPNIKLCIVGYNLDAKAKSKLQDLTVGLNTIQFLEAPTPKELAVQLEEAISERPYEITGAAARKSKLGEPLTGLPPGEYEVSFPGFKSAKATIAGGEKLVFELDHEAGEKRIRHVPHPGREKPPPEVGTWEESATEDPNRLVKYSAKRTDEGVEIVVAMDRTPDSFAYVKRPELVQFLLIRPDARGKDKFLPFTMELEQEQSVPAWRLKVSSNDLPPRDAMPELAVAIRAEFPAEGFHDRLLAGLKEPKRVKFHQQDVTMKAREIPTADGTEINVEIQGIGFTLDRDQLLNTLPWMELGSIDPEFVPAKPVRRTRLVYFEDEKAIYTWEFVKDNAARRTHLRFGAPQLQKNPVNGKIIDDAQ